VFVVLECHFSSVVLEELFGKDGRISVGLDFERSEEAVVSQ